MTEESVSLEYLRRKLSEYDQKNRDSLHDLKGAGGGGTSGGMEERLALLEKAVDRIDSKLDKISTDISQMRIDVVAVKARVEVLPDAKAFGEMKGKVDTMPSGEAFGRLANRVERLPTVASLSGLLALGIAVMTAAIHLRTIFGWFGVTF